VSPVLPVSDLKVRIKLLHTYVGDLIISLRHDSSNTQIEIINPDNGCLHPDIDVTLDDNASLDVNTVCSPGKAIEGVYKSSIPHLIILILLQAGH
jgi:subtilisin-like proprotein convertase family protein